MSDDAPRITADDLLVSDTVTGTVHAFREDAPRAVCGHRSTRRNFASVDVKPAPDAAWRSIECENCQRALASRYRSVCDEWEAVRALEEDDVVRLHVAPGEFEAAVVTSAADDLEPGSPGTLYVTLTTEPGTVSYQRDTGDDYRLICREGETPTLQVNDLLEELDDDENPKREVEAPEVVGTHDYYAGEDPDAREALLHAAEQVAAEHDSMAEGTSSSEERLWNVNYATAVRDVAYRLRSDEWPVAWVRQKVESKVDVYDGHPETVLDGGPLSEVRDEYAKAKGKAAGYDQALRLLDEFAPVEGDDQDGEHSEHDPEPKTDPERFAPDGGATTADQA